MTERIYEARNRAFSLLENRELDGGSIPILLQHITNYSYAMLLANMQTELTEEQHFQFWRKVEELLEGKPVQYVIGVESFYGRIFKVNEHVLIPRPETEELIYNALERKQGLFKTNGLKVADIGTGSGAIAVTLKLETPKFDVTATDISEEALDIAKENAKQLGADVHFTIGDLAEPLAHEKWDIVLSNPPYIAAEEAREMTGTVLDYEPHQALFAAEEGLLCYRKLADQLPQMMNTPGLIGLEIGYAQGEAVANLFKEAFPTASVDIVRDINGKDRMVFCEIRSSREIYK